MPMEEHLARPISYKVRKAVRYARLYGPRRTLRKIQAAYHMASEDGFSGKVWKNPGVSADATPRNTGIVGCGAYPYSTIAYYLQLHHGYCIKGVMDISAPRAKSLARRYRAHYATVDIEEIASDEDIRLVYIASSHSSHAPYACRLLDAGKDVYIEKPHVVDDNQLEALLQAIRRNPDRKIFLGFNRPHARLVRLMKAALEEEDGPMMLNFFVIGHMIGEDHWYSQKTEGGRILGNLCHWTDLLLHLVGTQKAFPCQIVPLSADAGRSDLVTSFRFADGTLAAITFSSKGETFEGVREDLHIQKGNIVVHLKDNEKLLIERGASKKRYRTFYRDPGHEANILNAYRGSVLRQPGAEMDVDHLVMTARLFLETKRAHEEQRTIILETQKNV